MVDTLQATASRSQNGVLGYLQGHKVNYKAFWVVNTIYIPSGTLDLARELAKRNEVAAIVPKRPTRCRQPAAQGRKRWDGTCR